VLSYDILLNGSKFGYPRRIEPLYLDGGELQLLLDLSRCRGLIPVAPLLSSTTAERIGYSHGEHGCKLHA
jgi:hypothetical protein